MKFGSSTWHRFLVTEHIHRHTHTDYFIIGIDRKNSYISSYLCAIYKKVQKLLFTFKNTEYPKILYTIFKEINEVIIIFKIFHLKI